MLSLGNEQMIDLVGQTVGKYYLRRVIGQGSYSYVYSGWHGYLQKEYAVKVLRPNLASSEQAAIIGEARRMATLDNHPNIVKVFDCGLHEVPPYTLPYIAMQYAPSTLLRTHPRGSRLAPAQVAAYVRQIASALDYAHANKIIHRDVKPENILVDKKGTLLLTDFGVAVLHGQNPRGTLAVIGTPTYMAPELILGYPSPASDQYALGIMVYEWLCGSAPFKFPKNVTLEVVYQTQSRQQPPSLRGRGVNIPPDLEQVVMIALSKRPENRFRNVTAFANALTQVCETGKLPPVPAKRPEPQGPISLPAIDDEDKGAPYKSTTFNAGEDLVPLPNIQILSSELSARSSTLPETLSLRRSVNRIKHTLKWDDRYLTSRRHGLLRLLGLLLNGLAAWFLYTAFPDPVTVVVTLLLSLLAFYLLVVIEWQWVTLPLAVSLALYWALTTFAFEHTRLSVPVLWFIVFLVSLSIYIYYIRKKIP